MHEMEANPKKLFWHGKQVNLEELTCFLDHAITFLRRAKRQEMEQAAFKQAFVEDWGDERSVRGDTDEVDKN